MDRRVWVRVIDSAAAECAEQVAQALRQERLEVGTFEAVRPACLGVLVTSEPGTELLAFVREQSAGGVHPMIVIVAKAEAFSDDCAWALLAAGARDVFAWRGALQSAQLVRERLERWLCVEQLMDSRIVRDNLVGSSRIWRDCLREVVETAHFSAASILLTGQSGTGKELVARLIHTLDSRATKGELVTLDCSTVVPELSGSEFFGHEKGSFTGASAARRGALALADQGTLFLDEVGELPVRLQAELLRAVQERRYKPVGANAWEASEFRLICATHRDLLTEEREGRFRLDFYHRIASYCVHLPSLDARREDIPPLTRHFIRVLRPDLEPELDEPVARYLSRRPYPGNIRELRQLTSRIVHRHVGNGPITVGDLPPEERPLAGSAARDWSDEAFERAVGRALARGAGLKDVGRMAEQVAVRLTVDEASGNLQVAAKRLGVSDRALQMRRAQKTNADP